ncbi:MAG: amidohydrolase family protein [Desulfobacterales bacterium]|nr:amidohydrolase family protein [Desulfobacterales bacterium]
MLNPNLPAIDDTEGEHLPAGLPMAIDAHVHVFPRNLFSAVWQWFDENAWHIRYRMQTREVFDFLLGRGLRHVVALQYAHRPGIAEWLNQYLADECRGYKGKVTGMATVFPGEDHAVEILRRAFDQGLGGVKLHAHVQCFDMLADEMKPIYALCQAEHKPLLMHVGREPKSPAYLCDPHAICSADRLEQILSAYPHLRICVPHLGFDELKPYRQLAAAYDNLWLDTTMVLTDYFPLGEAVDLRDYRPDRIMYGSDFPNIPYAWDRELKCLRGSGLTRSALDKLLWQNAAEFYDLAL